jgi:anti-sigma factor RsiW
VSPDVSPNLPALTCDECEELLGAYLDEELDAPARGAVERHLRGCAACRSRDDRQRALGDALRQQLPTYAAPDLLRARITSAVRDAAAHAAPVTPAAQSPATTASLAKAARRWRLAAIAASALFVVSTTYGVVATRGAGRGAERGVETADDAVAHDVLASHVRSLMPGHLTDVASSNRHNVKPWFNGRLDYSPPVYDFADAGFPLVGGRVDYVGSRAVAVLVYQRRQHVISLYVWPDERGDESARAATRSAERMPERTRQGYHVLSWTRGGMRRWAISDLNGDELREFARLEQRTDSLAAARERAADSR